MMKVIQAKVRVNAKTLDKAPNLAASGIIPGVRRKLLKRLYSAVEDANVIDIVSEPNAKGGLVFTATLKAMPREEA